MTSTPEAPELSALPPTAPETRRAFVMAPLGWGVFALIVVAVILLGYVIHLHSSPEGPARPTVAEIEVSISQGQAVGFEKNAVQLSGTPAVHCLAVALNSSKLSNAGLDALVEGNAKARIPATDLDIFKQGLSAKLAACAKTPVTH